MSTAQRYHVRSPRFVLNTSDHRTLRFARLETRGQASESDVLNLSETGLAFEIHEDHAPSEGDVLKVEFNVPEQSKIACFATVVRVEPISRPAINPEETTVGEARAAEGGTPDRRDSSGGDERHWQPVADLGHPTAGVVQLVGLQFRNLPSAYRQLLANGLKNRPNGELIIDWKKLRRQQLASFAGLCLATLALLVLLSTPCQAWFEALKSLL